MELNWWIEDWIAISLSDGNELVLNVRESVHQVDRFDLVGTAGALLDLGPSVNLDAHVLSDDVGVGIADCDEGTLLDHVQLVVLCNHHGAAVLVSNNALSSLVNGSLVSSSLSGDLDALNLEVHGDASSRLQLLHCDESRLLQNDWLFFWLGFYSRLHINFQIY